METSIFSRHTYKELKQSFKLLFIFLKMPRLFLNCNRQPDQGWQLDQVMLCSAVSLVFYYVEIERDASGNCSHFSQAAILKDAVKFSARYINLST